MIDTKPSGQEFDSDKKNLESLRIRAFLALCADPGFQLDSDSLERIKKRYGPPVDGTVRLTTDEKVPYFVFTKLEDTFRHALMNVHGLVARGVPAFEKLIGSTGISPPSSDFDLPSRHTIDGVTVDLSIAGFYQRIIDGKKPYIPIDASGKPVISNPPTSDPKRGPLERGHDNGGPPGAR